MMKRHVMVKWLGVLVVVACFNERLTGQQGMAGEDVLKQHPAADALLRAFEQRVPADFRPTGLSKKDYLSPIAGNVDSMGFPHLVPDFPLNPWLPHPTGC